MILLTIALAYLVVGLTLSLWWTCADVDEPAEAPFPFALLSAVLWPLFLGLSCMDALDRRT